MAEQADIDAFRELLPQSSTDYLTDAQIGAMLDAGDSQNSMFWKFWTKVASDTYELIDMSESGSSRSLSNIHRNAVAMAKMYRDLLDKEEEPETPARGIRSKRIVRV